jgi:hypothetical protein
LGKENTSPHALGESCCPAPMFFAKTSVLKSAIWNFSGTNERRIDAVYENEIQQYNIKINI